MNCLWILLLLFCCNGNDRGGNEGDYCSMGNRCERRERRECGERMYHGNTCPRPPFSPEYDRECDRNDDRNRDRGCEAERDRDCSCRASEIDHDDCEE